MSSASTLRSLPSFLILVPLLLLGVVAAAQEAGEVAQPAETERAQAIAEAALEEFEDSIDVRVINLDTIVTDRSGRRLADLQPSDFTILVDDQEVELAYFSEVRDGVTQAPPEAMAGSLLQPNQKASVNYLIFIDEAFTRPHDRREILSDVALQLDDLEPQDRVAVAAFNGEGVDVLSAWTTDRDFVRAALDTAAMRWQSGLNLESQRAAAGTCYQREAVIAQQVENLALGAAAAMQTLTPMAEPGRRALLWVSGGWTFEPSLGCSDELETPSDGPQTSSQFGGGDELITEQSSTIGGQGAGGFTLQLDTDKGDRRRASMQAFVDLVNHLSYSVYSVDAPGWEVSGLESNDGAVSTLAVEGVDNAPTPPGWIESSKHETFNFLARETGGEAYINSFRKGSLERTVQDSRSYYSLGFHSPFSGDDQRHSIEVKVRREGAKARARTSYVDLSPGLERDLAARTNRLVALYDDATPQSRLVARIGQIERKGRRMEVPLELLIPVDDLETLTVEGLHQLRLEVRLAAIDEKGRRSEVFSTPIVVQGVEEPRPGQVATYRLNASLPRGVNRLLVAVHDTIGETILSTGVTVAR